MMKSLSEWVSGEHCPFTFNIHVKQGSYYKWPALEEGTQEANQVYFQFPLFVEHLKTRQSISQQPAFHSFMQQCGRRPGTEALSGQVRKILTCVQSNGDGEYRDMLEHRETR